MTLLFLLLMFSAYVACYVLGFVTAKRIEMSRQMAFLEAVRGEGDEETALFFLEQWDTHMNPAPTHPIDRLVER